MRKRSCVDCIILEVVRECLEDAGEVDYRGRPIGCYVGTFGQDWYEMAAKDTVFELTSSLSEIENVDLARATIDLKMQEVAYQAALASTARLVQPSLADFLR